MKRKLAIALVLLVAAAYAAPRNFTFRAGTGRAQGDGATYGDGSTAWTFGDGTTQVQYGS